MPSWKQGLNEVFLKARPVIQSLSSPDGSPIYKPADGEACGLLFEKIQKPAMVHLARRFPGLDEPTREAILSEAIDKFFYQGSTLKYTTGTNDDSAWAWIRQSLDYVAKNYLRNRSTRIECGDDELEDVESKAYTSSNKPELSRPTEECMINNLSISEVWSQLSERERTIMAMIYQGYPNTEIGKALGLHASRISQILKEVRSRINKKRPREIKNGIRQ